MALNTIYQLIHNQSFDGEELANVYFFNHAVGTGTSVDLATDFETDVLPAVEALQCVQVVSRSIDVINLGDLADFYSLVIPAGHGALEGEMLPIFNAIGYTLKLDTRAVRPGSKRIAGIPEVEQVDGTITNAGYLASMESLRIILENNVVGAADTWQPVVLKRVRTAVAGTVPLKYRYRLPRTDDELVFGGVTVALTSPDIKHQVSRGNQSNVSAVVYVTLTDFFENIKFQLEDTPEAATIIAAISAEELLNPAWELITLTDSDKHDILKKLTGCTVALEPDINCYPRGEAEVVCFDLSGDPIP